MFLLLCPDFQIKQERNALFLRNIHYPNTNVPINIFSAFLLALHDGTRDNVAVSNILQYVFKDKYEKTPL
jgi:methyltransferase-like protein